MQASDLSRIVTQSDPRIHGDRVVSVRTSVDLGDDRYVNELWLHESGHSRRLTSGPRDTSPRWAPDGRHLAFLRSSGDEPPQVAVIPVDGGEAEVITDFALGVEGLEWSPDGSRLVVTAVTWTEDWSDLDDDERQRRPRRIGSVPYRFDVLGWTHDRKRHLWVIDRAGQAEPVCLTPGEFDERNPVWSPDGGRIAFLSDRSARQGLEGGIDVWELEVDGSENPVRVTERGSWVLVGYRPDGVLHVLGHPETNWPQVSGVYRRESDGTLEPVTASLDRAVVSLVAGPPRIVWDGDTLHTLVEDMGTVGVLAVPAAGAVSVSVGGERIVTGFDVADDRTVFAATTPTAPASLFEVTADGEAMIAGSDPDFEVIDTDHFQISTAGGEVDVWVCLPPGYEPVPVLLNIHGGPASQYGFGFFDEFQVYAGAGFGVVACNPRGSSGRGEAFLKAVTADGWGVVDVEDVTAALDGALERYPRLNPDAMGVMGGSYGGFLTAWMIAREDRFRSAVVERALVSWTSFSGTSDIGGRFAADYLGADYPDGWERWWEASPLAHAHQVKTPTLVLHSDADLRCPIEQAEQYFMALLRNGTPAEFLRFPGEGHEMSRSGKPRHRVERFDAIVEWHRRWLDDRPTRPDAGDSVL